MVRFEPYRNRLRRVTHAVACCACLAGGLRGAQAVEPVPWSPYHLTARPWRSSGVTRAEILATVERGCRYLAGLQDATGAVIDPERGREFQYATPYFACAVGALLDAGQAADLGPAGVAAMEHATQSLAGGAVAIPDRHGEFFIAPLTTALAWYEPHVDETTVARWRERLRTPLIEIMENQHGRINNWRTYAMKGEWLRAEAGLVPQAAAVAMVEDAWRKRTQRTRIVPDRWNLYQDWSSDPASHAVEAVGRGNLLALAADDYDGPSGAEIRRAVVRGTAASLLWQSPTGECPPNGRTDDHVFNDIVFGLCAASCAPRPSRGRRRSGIARRRSGSATTARSPSRRTISPPRTGSATNRRAPRRTTTARWSIIWPSWLPIGMRRAR